MKYKFVSVFFRSETHTISQKKMDMMVSFINEHTSHKFILVIIGICAKQLISTVLDL